MSGGGDAPAVAASPPPPPPPTYRADDGTTFSDMDAYNTYNSGLREKTFKSQVASSLNSATQHAKNAFSQYNINDPLALDNLIGQYQTASTNIPDLDSNPASYLDNSTTDNYITQLGTTQKNGYLNTLNGALPTNFSSSALPTGYGSDFVGNYLTGLQGTIDSEISNAQKRGQLDPAGLQMAQAEEQRQAGVGRAHLQGMANDLATSDRSAIDTARQNAFTAANNWTLGSQPIDATGYINGINDTVNTDKSGFNDAFLAQADGYNPFDINQILLKAGIGTGPTNSQGDATAAAITAGTQKKDQPRGLGTTGDF